jgi:dipeptidyl aminopeptidase/acylaminoacyl peptidase
MSTAYRDRGYWSHLAKVTAMALAVGIAGSLVGYQLLASASYIQAFTHPGCGDMGIRPIDLGIEDTQDITYPSHDGLTLRAWYLPPQNNAVIILLPGLGGARDGMLQEAEILARHGYGVFMTDFRSCGHPDGLSTLGHHEAIDLKEAATWVLEQPNVAKVGVLGYSMGGVTAILGAAQDARIEAVVAQGGFFDLTADITERGKQIPLTSRLMYSTNPLFFRFKTGVSTQSISPINVIGRIGPRPLLLIYGEHEVDEAHAREQYEMASDPKQLWIVPNCGHGGYLQVEPEEWEQRVVTFFNEALLP